MTPWGTWITCEETGVAGHGWTFDVGVDGGIPTPLKDMGRFSHEALMVDPRTGYVFETEDSGDCGLYKFVPYRRGRLEQGGKLYMLAIRNQPQAISASGFRLAPLGRALGAHRRSARNDGVLLRARLGQRRRAFSRLEGAWWGEDSGFFLSTNGGSAGEGQVFEYDPRDETLKLIYDAPNATDARQSGQHHRDAAGRPAALRRRRWQPFTEGERLVGLTLHGQTFTFAMNNMNLTADYNTSVKKGDYRQIECAGACYSPDGRWLFVNIQTPGVTFAITGPWGRGPL